MATNFWRFPRNFLALFLLVVGACSILQAESSHGDDGWRRTAQGWERMVSEGQPPIRIVQPRPIQSPPKNKRAVPHPLLLAAVQVSLIAAAYWRLPVKV